jgi:hypothetical protein
MLSVKLPHSMLSVTPPLKLKKYNFFESLAIFCFIIVSKDRVRCHSAVIQYFAENASVARQGNFETRLGTFKAIVR